jgi:amino acid transporter
MTDTSPDAPGAATQGHGFGTLPVFLAAISTILGAIMFLRFGYAVGHVGMLGAIAIIVLGHLVTVPTALAIAEIATNRKVEGGGEYFIISRSFGKTIGSVIGISLYLSQAVSVAFYMIAFAEAFQPLAMHIEQLLGLAFDPRMISIPATLLLVVLMLTKGASMGVAALNVVVVTLAASLIMLFVGQPVAGFDQSSVTLTASVKNAHPFFHVFSICFPAFTGMTAGVGLSGDLKNPRRSIPLGTLSATVIGMVVYFAIVVKLAYSAPLDLLATDQLVMAKIAVWGPMILIGLGCATLSSAIGSILVAPRTLQALGADAGLPLGKFNGWIAAGHGAANEPRRATLVTSVFALVVVFLGNVDFVARLISMFFMVTYGSLCAISFMEHFAARPSYRPSFRSRWYVSLFGAGICLFMMLQMDPVYAISALVILAGLYWVVSRRQPGDGNDLAAMFEGVMTQLTRYLQIQLQRRTRAGGGAEWRPSVIMVSDQTFKRRAPLELMRWICYRYGFGTYLHFIEGRLDNTSYHEAEQLNERLVSVARSQKSPVFMDTIVSPSIISALAQSLQVPGISGLNNNTALFEFSEHDEPSAIAEVVKGCLFAASTEMGLLVLRHGDHHFGDRRTIHIWLTWNDKNNANLMVLLAYMLLAHPDWHQAEISVFAALPGAQVGQQRHDLEQLMFEGRIPISKKNVRFIAVDDVESFRQIIAAYSNDADLVIVGFDLQGLAEREGELFTAHPSLRAVLFVQSAAAIEIE